MHAPLFPQSCDLLFFIVSIMLFAVPSIILTLASPPRASPSLSAAIGRWAESVWNLLLFQKKIRDHRFHTNCKCSLPGFTFVCLNSLYWRSYEGLFAATANTGDFWILSMGFIYLCWHRNEFRMMFLSCWQWDKCIYLPANWNLYTGNMQCLMMSSSTQWKFYLDIHI